MGLAAAIEALESTTGRPLVWATAQYLSFARPPSVMDIDVTIPTEGHSVTQARAVAHVEDTEILTVNAALGHREFDAGGQWGDPPDVPSPERCPLRRVRHPVEHRVDDHIEVRLAHGHQPDDMGDPIGGGRSALWARIPELREPSSAALAILGDFLPFGIGQALGIAGGGTSLDNTLRVARPVATDWVLLDVRIDSVANGFGHGVVRLWSDDGTLMGMASQSTIVRYWKD